MNTLELVNIFEKRKFTKDEAIQIAEAINGKSGLATREDLSGVKAELKEDIAEVKNDIVWIKWILGISITLTVAGMLFLYTRMDANHKELNQKMDGIENRLNQKIDGIKDLIIQEMRK